ncbi:MAG: hypothetical protein RL398_2241 [Planctomycetota bacterium]
MNRITALAVASLAAAAAAQSAPPRLLVLCSVDQLAAWVYAQGSPYFADDGGFRRLLRSGMQWASCTYDHACTETGPGHATIGTGAPAAAHGIVRNSWFDPAVGKNVYCAGHEQAPLADLPEGKDRGPARLTTPTLGDMIKAHVPGAKVASVSWKDRSAILMAGASADIAVWGENATGRFVTNTVWCEATPAWLTSFNEAKLVDSYHGWVWDRIAPADAYAGLVDDRPYEYVHGNGSKSRTLPQPLTGGTEKPSSAFYTQVYASPVGNELVGLLAEACVDGMQLGADRATDLLCVSFSSTDIVGHYFGPDSVEARDALLRLDRQLARLMNFFDRKVGEGNWAMFLTADHGVGPTPEWARSQGVDAGRGALSTMARAAAEAALRAKFGAPAEGAKYLAHVGEYSMFLDRKTLAAQLPQLGADELLAAARVAAAAAMKTPGIVQAFATADLDRAEVGTEKLRAAFRAALHPERAGDVQLVAKPYWLDGTLPASHGTPHSYDREVVAFAVGGGAPAGVLSADPITPGFGAVWFAQLLGLPRPSEAVDHVPAALLRR